MIIFNPLSQQDPRWGSVILGYNSPTAKDLYNRPWNIQYYGCAITCMAMLLDTTPPEINDWLKAREGFQPGTGLLSPEGWRLAGFSSRIVYMGASRIFYGPVPLSSMSILTASLNIGNRAILLVDPTPASPGIGVADTHFVLAIASSCDNQLIIADPWYGDIAPISPRYERSSARAVYQIHTYEA